MEGMLELAVGERRERNELTINDRSRGETVDTSAAVVTTAKVFKALLVDASFHASRSSRLEPARSVYIR
jgi:hypothetical protein